MPILRRRASTNDLKLVPIPNRTQVSGLRRDD
jgi:hypothetical protein